MSEEEHYRFVLKRVQQLDSGKATGEGEAAVEGFATEESLLSMVRLQVLHLADVYKEYLDEFDLLEAGGGLNATLGVDEEVPWGLWLMHRFLGPALPLIVLALVLSLAAAAAACFVLGALEPAAVLLALSLSPFGALLR